MHRRSLLMAVAALAAAPPARAHHGWSSFDQGRPLYIEGALKRVQWRNPHAEAVLEVGRNLALPPGIAGRALPAQQQEIDTAALLRQLQVPADAAGDWEVEFAPLTRMEAWQIAPLAPGQRIGLIGYAGVAGKPRLMRVEYLLVGDRTYGLRSAPR